MIYLKNWNKGSCKSSVQNGKKELAHMENIACLQAALTGLEIEWFTLYVRSISVSHFLFTELTLYL